MIKQKPLSYKELIAWKPPYLTKNIYPQFTTIKLLSSDVSFNNNQNLKK